ncbi:MAG TPA: hypothetical protein VF777_06790 [Phycisphaerales bacterium]
MAYKITFTNFTKTNWVRSVNGSLTDAVFQNLTVSPGPTLKATGGTEAIGADQSALSFVASGNIDLHCCWKDPASGLRFGVQIWVPVQVLGIGKAPYWFVMCDNAGVNDGPNWISSGDDPSYMYTFSGTPGYKITARPTASHSSLEIQVNIEAA